MNAVVQAESTALSVSVGGFDYLPTTFDEAWQFSQMLANSDLVPKDFKGKPENCFLAMMWGRELGLRPMSAIQNIAIVNGRPSLWGDVMLALVRQSPLCEYVVEEITGDKAVCRAKRRGQPEQVREFSREDAQTAGLWVKAGPWTQYPKRMLQMRARAWALRDVFTDLLRGLHMAEEAMDMPPAEKFMGPADVVQPGATATGPSAGTAGEVVHCWPDDLFQQRLPEWRKAIATGRATADAVVAKAKSKHPLSAAQEAAIRSKDEPKATASEGAPLTYAEVADKLEKAGTREELYVACDLIKSVAEEQQRVELTAIFERRDAELA